jgi:hypothetical protein
MTPALVRAVPHLENPGTAAGFLAVLSSQLGYRETGDNDNFFGRWYGQNHAPWCAMFQTWGSRMSGCAKVIPRFAYTPEGAHWFREHDRWHATPRVGDLGFVYGPTRDGARIHHVFAVLAVLGSHVLTVEGNTNNTGSAQGNGVYSLKRRADRGPHGGYGRPAYAPGPSVRPPVDLSDVLHTARTTGTYTGRVAVALNAEGLPAAVAGYARWQHQLGYRGRDADGIAGMESLTKLGDKYGWQVKP